MNAYERCLAAIQGLPTDRVPAYTPTIACDVASQVLGRPVHTGSPSLWYAEALAWCRGDAAHAEFEQQMMEDEIALNRAIGQEVIRQPYRRNVRPSRQLDEYTFLYGDPDGVHQVWRWDPVVQNFYEALDTTPRLAPERWAELVPQRERNIEAAIQNARQHAGVYEAQLQARLGTEMLVAAGGGGLSLGLEENALMAALLEPEAVGDLLDLQLAVGLAQMEGIAARGVKVVLGGGDMADKNGPLYSPRLFRLLILPRLCKLAARCRELGLHYVWRTDGQLWLVSDMIFCEAGVPGYGEVDWEAGMQSGLIRARYPDLVLWGNGSGDLMRRGTRQQVYDHAMQMLVGSGGRAYFHGCSNTVLPGTPVENLWALMEARDDFKTASV